MQTSANGGKEGEIEGERQKTRISFNTKATLLRYLSPHNLSVWLSHYNPTDIEHKDSARGTR